MATKHALKRLKQVVDQAQTRLDLETAQNPDLQRAIYIVEDFLRSSGRVCYGGQAINAQLPQKDQFYNPETSLPDYDFFSPDEKEDAKMLIDKFKEAGYTEISKRIGIHEGTTKIYINYTAIADITQIDPRFYEQISSKSIVINGIHYTDPIFLRMMMYLELSRPRGMLSRWEKVFERLNLLDAAHPLSKCRPGNLQYTESSAAQLSRYTTLRYILKNNRVFMGADIHALYKTGGPGRSAMSRTRFLLKSSAPVVFLSPDAFSDADKLASQLKGGKVEVTGYQNILPAMIAIVSRDNRDMLALIVQEEACHSTYTVQLTKKRQLRIASIDTMLTFLIGLYYRKNPLIMPVEALLCWMQQYVNFSMRYRNHPSKIIPAFSIECSGYQTTFASLLRAKGARIEAERQRIGSGARAGPKTRGKRFLNMGTRRTQKRRNL